MKNELKVYGRIIVTVLCLASLVVVYHWAADKWRAPPVVPITQQQAQTVPGVLQAAQQAHAPISQYQAVQVAQAVQQSARKKPDQVVSTTGSEWERVTEQLRKKGGSDFSIVTDPKRPNEKPAVKPNEPVNLNVYNVKAYPKTFDQIGWAPGEVMAAKSWQIVKTKTKSWYMGVYGRADLNHQDRSCVGIMVTRM